MTTLFVPRTILGRLIAGTLLMQSVVFACFLFFGVRAEARKTEAVNAARLRRQAGIIASLTQEALAERDEKQLASVFRGISITTTLQGARLTDRNGTTLRVSDPLLQADLSPEERGLLFDLNTKPGYRVLDLSSGMEVAVLPFQQGNVQGMLWLYPNDAVTARVPKLVLKYATMYGLWALIGNLLLVVALSSSIATPLRRLRTASLGAVHHPEDLSAFPLPVRGQSETAELTDGVNAMVAEVERQRASTNETLSLLDSMLVNAPVGFAFFDRENRYVRVNHTLADIHAVPLEDHPGRRLREMLPPGASTAMAEQVEHWIQHVFQHGEAVFEREIRGKVRSSMGVERVWLDTFYPVRTRDGVVKWVGVIIQEVTEKLKAEEALRRSEKLAAAGRLAASIAHEINNPLESVTNLLYLLSLDSELTGKAQGWVDLAQKELARVAEITQQTLRFYRQSSSALDTRVDEVLRSVLVLHHGKLLAARIEVARRMDASARLYAYTGELRQVFANLVCNAIDAMPTGGRMHLRVRPGTRLGEAGVWITVADTGIGMSDAVRRRIFEPFFTTKDATGTGLGLWVSSEIVQKHRGVMVVRSRAKGDSAGQIALVQQPRSTGTVFRLFLPYNGVPRTPLTEPEAPSSEAGAEFPRDAADAS